MLMRVSAQMSFEFAKANIAATQQRYYAANRVAMTGQRLQDASDNPTLASYQMGTEMDLDQIEMFKANNTRAKAHFEYADSALAQVGEALNKVNELSIAALNASYNANDRVVMANQIASLRDSSIQMANNQVDGVFVFSGYKTDSAPFDALGNFIGDKNERMIEVNKDMYEYGSSPGYRYFTSSAGGVDVFKVMDDLQAAMRANNVTLVSSLRTTLKQAQDQIAAARTDTGNRSDRIEMAMQAVDNNKTQIINARQGVIDADPSESSIELLQHQFAYQMAIQVSAQLKNFSILNYL